MDSRVVSEKSLNQTLYFFLWISMMLAGYIGARMPSLWSVNYYLPSFFEGFYRRGAMGTLLFFLGDHRFDYTVISRIQITVFSLLLLSIVYYAYRASIQKKMVLILFFLAPTGGYLFHLVGYTDQLLYLLLFIALASRHIGLGLGLMLFSLFIHEAALFTTIPLYFVSLLIRRVSIKWILIQAAILIMAFLGLTLCWQTVPTAQIESFIQKVQVAFGPFARTEYYLTFHNQYTTQALTNTFVGLHGEIAPTPQGNFDFLYFEITVLVLFVFLMARSAISSAWGKGYNAVCFISVCCAGLSPLFLVFWGIDSFRWVFLAYASSVVLFCMIKNDVMNRRMLLMFFIFSLFLAYGHFWYFDGCAPRGFEWPQLKAFFLS